MNAQPSGKPSLREIMKKRRAEAQAQNPNAPAALRDHFLSSVTLPGSSVIAGYIAKDHEIDPALLMKALHTKGHKLALPVMTDENRPLAFRSFTPGDVLMPGIHGILEPAETIPMIEPDIVLVPLLAFDRNGHRLGRGGGHYDRALAALRKRREILAVGLAFAMQQVPIIPTDSHDARLDKIVTETEVIQILKHS